MKIMFLLVSFLFLASPGMALSTEIECEEYDLCARERSLHAPSKKQKNSRSHQVSSEEKSEEKIDSDERVNHAVAGFFVVAFLIISVWSFKTSY